MASKYIVMMALLWTVCQACSKKEMLGIGMLFCIEFENAHALIYVALLVSNILTLKTFFLLSTVAKKYRIPKESTIIY